jgi:hypothetical protein
MFEGMSFVHCSHLSYVHGGLLLVPETLIRLLVPPLHIRGYRGYYLSHDLLEVVQGDLRRLRVLSEGGYRGLATDGVDVGAAIALQLFSQVLDLTFSRGMSFVLIWSILSLAAESGGGT